MPGECDIKQMSPIGITTSIQFYPDNPLEHGKFIFTYLQGQVIK